MKIYRFDEIDSTNDFMKRNEELEDFSLAIAEKQIKGRGRFGKKWYSEEGGAWFTFSLKEDKNIREENGKITLLAGKAVEEYLSENINMDFKIKWPNDVYINNKKICGILTEKRDDFFIIGIGVNVNIEVFGEFEKTAESLYRLTGEKYNIEKIIFGIIDRFKIIYNRFLKGEWKIILNEINEKNYLENKEISVLKGSEEIKGKVLKINSKGWLVLEKEDKNEIEIDSGEIRF